MLVPADASPTRRVDVDPRFGDRVRELRAAKGWSQRQLAEQAGIAKRTVEGYEAGRRPRKLLPQVADALGVTPHYLAHGEETLETRVTQLTEAVEGLRSTIERNHDLTLRASTANRRIWTTVDATLRAVLFHLSDRDVGLLDELPPPVTPDNDD